MKYFVVLLLTLTLVEDFSCEPEIQPPSKTIDINEGGSYTIEFKEDNTTDIRKCYYISETISGSFDVIKQETNNANQFIYSSTSNTITEYGQAGWCRIDVKNVDADGPKLWTLIAYDVKNDKNVTAGIVVNFYYNIDLLLSRVVVRETGSFIQHTTLPATTQISECQLLFNGTTLNLTLTKAALVANNDVASSKLHFSLPEEDTHISKRLYSLGRGTCGFKLINITTDDPREFTFLLADTQNNKYKTTFSVIILSQESRYKSLQVTLGESVYLSCGMESTDQYFCHFYEPNGNLIQSDTRCSLTLDMVTTNHIGVWKCRIGVEYLMETPIYEVEVIQKANPNVTTWVEESSDYINIGCRFNNYDGLTSGSSYCQMVAPNQEIFKIQPGAASGRYTTLTTNLTAYTCGMEIEKPLHDFEKGIWECKIYLINDDIGGFLRVGISENVTSDYAKHKQKTIRLDEAFQVDCKVPYSTKYCHIKAPNGTIYPTNNQYKTYLGECILKITKSVASDNGTWVCSFARENGHPDEEIYFDVTIADILNYYQQAEVVEGNNAELLCSSGGIPLQYCRFISPQGIAYYLESEISDTGIAYKGQGLEKGECGVNISNANTTHAGNWTCVTRLGYNNFRQSEISAVIQLDVVDAPSSSAETAIAASIGSVGGVLLVVLGYAGYKFNQNRKRKNEAAASSVSFSNDRSARRSNGSDSSSGSGTVIVATDATYNTVNNN